MALGSANTTSHNETISSPRRATGSRMVKKVLAFTLAGAMALGMSAIAFAKEPINLPSSNSGASATLTIPVSKTIWFYNGQGASVYEPNIKYTFRIAPADVGSSPVTVTDSDRHSAAVKAGDMRAFGVAADAANQYVEASVLFSSDHQIVPGVSSNGKGVTKGNSFTFTGTNLTSADDIITPGIYRYVITESSNVTPASVGIARPSSYDNTLILDVYVDKDGNVTGSTIHDPTDPSDDPTKPVGPTTNKTTGFGDGVEPTNPEPIRDPDDEPTGQTATYSTTVPTDALETEDTYTTYNFEVNKTVSGSMGDTSNDFPFTITIDNGISTAAYTSFADTTSATADASLSYTPATGIVKEAGTTTFSPKLKHTEKFRVKGVPSAQDAALTLTVVETNNTGDTYTVTAQYDSSDIRFDSNNSSGTISNGTSVAAGKDKTAGTAATSINTANANVFAYTNNLEAVSPTGLALRYAPYIIMIGAAIALVAFTRRRREEA